MSKGFDIDSVEFDVKNQDIDKLLKKYKKLKKYQKSSLFTIKEIDGTENVISKMVDEAKDLGF